MENKNNLGLCGEQIYNAIIGEDIYGDPGTPEEDKILFEWVDDRILSSDQEKSSTTRQVVIKEVATGKYYKATLGESPWRGQEEANEKEEWKEVFPKETVIITYE